jgi:hypothetical protein
VQLDPHPRLLGLALQQNSLKVGSNKFNIIFNIKNITIAIMINIIKILFLNVIVKSKTFWYRCADIPLNLGFYIYNVEKNNTSRATWPPN